MSKYGMDLPLAEKRDAIDRHVQRHVPAHWASASGSPQRTTNLRAELEEIRKISQTTRGYVVVREQVGNWHDLMEYTIEPAQQHYSGRCIERDETLRALNRAAHTTVPYAAKSTRLISDIKPTLATLSATCSLENAGKIDDIREQAEEICIEAESHLQLLAKRLDPIPLAPEPELILPDEISEQMDSAALASARQLIRAVLHIVPDAEADLDVASNGSVEVAWRVPNSLIWIVGRPPMSWPGVRVRSYARLEPSSPKMQIRSFYLAHRVIEQAQSLLVGK